MLKVYDLSLEDDILPLFNYTNSGESESLLKQIINKPLGSISEIHDRQQIIQALILNWDVLEAFSYQRLDYREVKNFLDDVASKRIVLETRQLKAFIKFTYDDSWRQQLRSRSVQVINFFHKLSSCFFSRLSIAFFPASFQTHLQVVKGFINKLSIEQQAELVAQQKFNLKATVHFSQKLDKLTPEEVSALWNSLAAVEAYISITKGILDHQFNFPAFNNNAFNLQNFYHPLLRDPVKNSLRLASNDNVVLLTGPNMSGKSTMLRAVSLCVYLAHIGFAVPASAAVIPYFDTISIAINTNDSLQDGYSHFMAEVKNLKAVVHEINSGKSCFAIFDELFRGTNSDDALDITATTIKGLAKYNNCYFFISTHLLGLKKTTSIQGVKQLSIGCTLNNDLPVFTYRLQPGWSELKIGRILFEKEGIPEMLQSEV
ncbi:DNA mismatch repair protein MutS [Pontibacter aydingkolensis]|uniref:DNA mismatch repair proteins mutS family domain-containing protein n=1 Tax=Pontibacter aydingkolensis TaxID=1911536 RepID=A0ABS7CP46_9BACT|nr:hypothetical protein [Pontibacter aydingkolensis]MBW7465617.1 hypothetical protein [Pontibacter aydingkolensis]